MRMFRPPVELVSMPFHWRTRIKQPTGVSVLKNGGFYTLIHEPSDEEMAGADAVYLGGRDYLVTDAEALLLEEAGYTTTEVVVLTPGEGGDSGGGNPGGGGGTPGDDSTPPDADFDPTVAHFPLDALFPENNFWPLDAVGGGGNPGTDPAGPGPGAGPGAPWPGLGTFPGPDCFTVADPHYTPPVLVVTNAPYPGSFPGLDLYPGS